MVALNLLKRLEPMSSGMTSMANGQRTGYTVALIVIT